MIKYFHDRHKFYSGTIALEIPTKETLMKILTFNGIDLELNFGISKLHPNDQYCKKVGREVASSKMKPTLFYLKYIDIKDPESYSFAFSTMQYQTIYLTIHRNSNKVYFNKYL